jgi:hypothetical protein
MRPIRFRVDEGNGKQDHADEKNADSLSNDQIFFLHNYSVSGL